MAAPPDAASQVHQHAPEPAQHAQAEAAGLEQRSSNIPLRERYAKMQEEREARAARIQASGPFIELLVEAARLLR
jgi:hypothetical protein